MNSHAVNAASEITKRMIDEGLLEDLFNYDATVKWMAGIIEREYQDAPIVFPEKGTPSAETILDAILEFGEGDSSSERLRDEW